ncbi:MAG: PGPGW domain-containing protein [Bryobacteraceae bacterium]|jgi:hypothetical protein
MRKIARIVAGFVLLGVGLIMAIPGVPGPGIAVIVLGLILLAEHFHWARRALDWAKQKAEYVRDKAVKRWSRPAPPPAP